MSTRLDFDVFAKDRASKTFRDIGNDAHRSGGLVRGFGRSLAGAVAGGAIYQGVKEIAGSLVDMGKAAMDDQQAQVVLAQQLKNSAGATRDTISAVETWISRAGTAYGVVDDDLRPALGRLVAATGDVTEAQRLARLAMDVSAGTGKSLESVTGALAKAQNGSVAGLAKLGVKTKDAEGNTRSLNDITKTLSKTYDGQAAKSAETAAGKYKRLGVQFDETKEAIGARLIPIGLELSDWLLKTAIPAVSDAASELQDKFGPAVSDLSDSVRDVLPEIKDFADGFGKTAVPALQDAAGAVSSVVGFIDDLPGPLKSMGAEVAIAALMLPRLKSGFTSATAGAKAFATNVGTAATRTATLGKAARGAAGVAGLVALTEGAKRGDDAMGTLLTTFGGAATGFAIGGPVGGAVGALGGLVTSLHQSDDQLKTNTSSWQDYAGALDQATGAMDEQTKATVYDTLQKSGALKAGQDLGLSDETLIKAALGRAGASREVAEAIAREKDAIKGLTVEAEKSKKVTSTTGRGAGPVGDSGQLGAITAETKARQNNIAVIEGEIKASAKSRAEIAAKIAVTKGVPLHVTTLFQTEGVPKTNREIAEVVRQYQLTPKVVRSVVEAVGGDTSVKAVQRIVANMKAKAAADSPAVGQALGDGVVGGFAGTEARLTGAARLAIRSAIAGAKAEADSHSPSKKMIKLGRDMGLGAELGLLSKKNDLSKAATEAIVSVLEKARERIQAKRGGLKDALQDVADDVKSKVDDMNAALSARSDFAAGFQSFASSIFDAPTPDKGPMSAGGLLDFASAQLAQAQKVQEAVNKLTSMGLSQSLIKQLQSKGSSGFDQLIALSSGSQEQINKANSLDKQTTDTLTAAGMTAADATDIGADAVAKTSAATLARLIGEQTAKALGTAEGDGETKITGDTLTIIQKKAARHRGRRNQ